MNLWDVQSQDTSEPKIPAWQEVNTGTKAKVRTCKEARSRQDEEENSPAVVLPPHLVALYEKSTENLKEADRRQILAEILQKYSDVLAKDKTNLGKCSIVKNRMIWVMLDLRSTS